MNARKSQENSLSHLDVNYVSLANSHAYDNDLQHSELVPQQQVSVALGCDSAQKGGDT